MFEKLHHILLAESHAADAVDWTRACVDASHVRTEKKGPAINGPSYPLKNRLAALERDTHVA